ncbi:hypothetical protein BDY21DRAFT_366289 [Lineolata rhizophorae]|uniref:WD40-repeat-containing domain protein n=1 Tax=Lineolata rhizophorae TaxID=578093 RepID=A0A6A6NS22_9PEZI|nr:hypothetical protein BDY21DRAFT_366289 [Lineolata rhizophorae]
MDEDRGFEEVSIRATSAQSSRQRFPKYHHGSQSHESSDFEHPPRILRWRQNLTAFSSAYNLYFLASCNRINIYRPEFLTQAIPNKPSLQIVPPSLPQALQPSHHDLFDPSSPHGINHILVDYLGNEEILLLCRDDGDVIAYRTRAIADNVRFREEAMTERAATGVADNLPFVIPVQTMVMQNVDISAWGLAVQREARMFAVSSNNAEVTVFAFALAEESSSSEEDEATLEGKYLESPLTQPIPSRGSELFFPDASTEPVAYQSGGGFKRLDRSRNQLIRLRGADANLPCVSMCNTNEDPEGRLVAAGDIFGTVYIWNVHERMMLQRVRARFCPWKPIFSEIVFAHVRGLDMQVSLTRLKGFTGSSGLSLWGLTWFDTRAFREANSVESVLGCKRRPKPQGRMCCGEEIWDTSVSKTQVRWANSVYKGKRLYPEPTPPLFEMEGRVDSDSGEEGSRKEEGNEDNDEVESFVNDAETWNRAATAEAEQENGNEVGQALGEQLDEDQDDQNLDEAMESIEHQDIGAQNVAHAGFEEIQAILAAAGALIGFDPTQSSEGVNDSSVETDSQPPHVGFARGSTDLPKAPLFIQGVHDLFLVHPNPLGDVLPPIASSNKAADAAVARALLGPPPSIGMHYPLVQHHHADPEATPDHLPDASLALAHASNDRMCFSASIPELGVHVVAGLPGRVAVLSLTQGGSRPFDSAEAEQERARRRWSELETQPPTSAVVPERVQRALAQRLDKERREAAAETEPAHEERREPAAVAEAADDEHMDARQAAERARWQAVAKERAFFPAAFRLDAVLPFAEQEMRGERPKPHLVGIAVGRTPRGEGGAGLIGGEEDWVEERGREGPAAEGAVRRWSLFLTYADGAVLSCKHYCLIMLCFWDNWMGKDLAHTT